MVFVVFVEMFVNLFFCVKNFAAFRAHVLSCSCLRSAFALYSQTQRFASMNKKKEKVS
jgi:hypothetical protein